jgi:hypothetical protein
MTAFFIKGNGEYTYHLNIHRPSPDRDSWYLVKMTGHEEANRLDGS